VRDKEKTKAPCYNSVTHVIKRETHNFFSSVNGNKLI